MNSLCLVIMIIENINNIETILTQSEKNFRLLIICNKSKYLSNYEKLKDTYKNNDNVSFLLQIDSNIGSLQNTCLQYFFNNSFTHLLLINSYDEYYNNFLKTMLSCKKDFVNIHHNY